MTDSYPTDKRHSDMLLTALGPDIEQLLEDSDIIEIMLNPDGKLWAESLTQRKFFTEKIISPDQSSHIIKLIASAQKTIADTRHPEVSCELAQYHARFQGWLPPIVSQTTFTIRKHTSHILTLADYLNQKQISKKEINLLKLAIIERKNILVSGGTGSGKTTFANALLWELKDSEDRIIILEDLPELQIASPDSVRLRTSPEKSMQALVKGTLRMRPDRIIIGEVRDGTALDLLKAWNTGHPGGLCTIHANSAQAALSRLEDLIQEAIPVVPKQLIYQAIDIVVFMRRDIDVKYKVTEVLDVKLHTQLNIG
jgi:P-type conjugative transfer ATPase TrbB